MTPWILLMTLATPLLDDLDWFVVNDTVMGGASTSSVEAAEGLRFTGVLSLEQNGGFTSVRSRPQALPLEGARALRLTLRGDGRSYDLTLRRQDVPLRAGSYRVPLDTQAGEEQVIEVPLSDFRPTSFGRPVAGAPALDADLGQVVSLGFLLADGDPGPFTLEVLAIEVVPGGAPRGPGHARQVKALQDAVTEGVPLFNAGDVAGCARVYAEALGAALQGEALTPGERSIAQEALGVAERQDPLRAAWTLRYAIDSVLASAP